jgi:hypothetical protein
MFVNKNILKELEEITPGFKWPENQAGFEVPDGYFQRFQDTVLNKITNSDLEKWPVFLNRDRFVAPAGYFESLPEKVLSKIKGDHKETSVVRLPRKHRNWQNWVAAAVIAAFVALGGLIWLTPHPLQNGQRVSFSLSQQLASVSNQAIEQYLISHVNTSNMNEVYNNLGDQDLQDTLTNGLSTSAIEEYLQNNAADSLSF